LRPGGIHTLPQVHQETGSGLLHLSGTALQKITPALTPLYIKDNKLGNLSGISLKRSRIIITRCNKKITSGKGIFFYTKGLSGPGILDLSRHVRSGDRITISLTDRSIQEVESLLLDALKNEGKKSIRNILKILELPEKTYRSPSASASVEPSKKQVKYQKQRET
jgi:predicted flavoprotein YhiN